MSPLVVASVLPPGQWFDVVVFDEASQVPPAEAVSAISRARQVVVAGDSRQLPPTSFFTTVTDGDPAAVGADEAITEGVESILDVLAAALPSRRLSWHYRSLDERLIAFANARGLRGLARHLPGHRHRPGGAPGRGRGAGHHRRGRGCGRDDADRGRPGRRAGARARPHQPATARSASSRSASPTRPGSTRPCAGPWSGPTSSCSTSSTRTGPSRSSSRTSSGCRATSATTSCSPSATARPRTAGCCTGSARSTSRAASGGSTWRSPGPGAR